MAMIITKGSLLSELRSALPQLRVDDDWAADELLYPIINDLARYIALQSDCGDEDELRASLAFVERCASQGDLYVRGLAHECIESLCVAPGAQKIKSAAGASTVSMWNAICGE
jgi:hypothetical protein